MSQASAAPSAPLGALPEPQRPVDPNIEVLAHMLHMERQAHGNALMRAVLAERRCLEMEAQIAASQKTAAPKAAQTKDGAGTEARA